MKRILAFCLTVAAILILALIWYRDAPPRPGEAGSRDSKLTRREARRPPSDDAASGRSGPEASATHFRVEKKVGHVPDYAAIELSNQNVPFAFKGRFTTGRVVDRQGNVLMESGEDIGIYGFSASPDNRHVLIKGGDAVNFIMDPATREKVQLPVRPAGANMLGLGSWHWIDNQNLVCVSGIGKVAREGRSLDDDNVAQSKLYLYNIVSRRFQEVDVTQEIDARVFGIAESHRDGFVSIVERASEGEEQREPAWFRINVE